jgi:phosphatidylethanolamine-binding protein (PEBP) family uncharacterized protein
MQSGPRSKMALAILIALALAGCGGSGSGSTSQASTTPAASASNSASNTSTSATAATTSTTASTSSTSPANEKVPSVNLQLASSVKLNPIPARYTCTGANESLPLSWGQVPSNTVEIDLFLFNLAPVHGKLFADWAVAGLKPHVHGIAAGHLPAGAIVGRNSYGETRYSVCPPKGKSVRYAFLLYALPKHIRVQPGFNAEALREKALHTAETAGLLGAAYKRA